VTQETLGGDFRIEMHPPFVLLAMAGRSLRHPTGSFQRLLRNAVAPAAEAFDTR